MPSEKTGLLKRCPSVSSLTGIYPLQTKTKPNGIHKRQQGMQPTSSVPLPHRDCQGHAGDNRRRMFEHGPVWVTGVGCSQG